MNDIHDTVEVLRKMVDIQCTNGNWNYNPYMYGMANGMIFALSLFDNEQQKYLEQPDEWLQNSTNSFILSIPDEKL